MRIKRKDKYTVIANRSGTVKLYKDGKRIRPRKFRLEFRA